MTDHRISSQQANHPIESPFVHPALYRPHEHVQPEQRVANPHLVGRDNQQDVQRANDGIPRPTGSVAMQGQTWYPYRVDAPHYYVAQYHPPSPPQQYPEPPYMYINRDIGADQVVPVQAQARAQAFAPEEFQENFDGYGAQPPAADPPEASSGIQHHPPPLANMPLQNGLRNLARHYLNNPDSLVNMIRIQPSPSGRFEVSITLELADIF